MSLFSSLFKSKKTPSYEGQTPYDTLLQGAGGKELYQTLQDRIAGRNVGFGDDYASKYSNPIIQNSKSQFTDYQLPELESELSATGRRKGSAGFAQIAQAYKNQGNQENDIFSRLQQRNEDQKRSEINASIPQLAAFNKGDVDTWNNAANAEYNRYTGEVNNLNNDFSTNQATAGRLANAAGQILVGQNLNPFQSYGSPQVSYGGQNYATSQPPAGYDYGFNPFSAVSRNATRNGQYGGIK